MRFLLIDRRCHDCKKDAPIATVGYDFTVPCLHTDKQLTPIQRESLQDRLERQKRALDHIQALAYETSSQSSTAIVYNNLKRIKLIAETAQA